MKNATLSMVLLCFYIFEPAFAKVEAVLGPIPLQQNVNLAVTPTFSAENEILISRDQYVISYNRNRRSLNWVAWKLEAKNIGSVQRTNNFAKDADLDKYLARVGGGRQSIPTSIKEVALIEAIKFHQKIEPIASKITTKLFS